MKKLFALLLALSLLTLAACGNVETPPADEVPATWEPFPYALAMDKEPVTHETLTDDGTVVCTALYEIPSLVAEGELNEAQQASLDAFHAAMDETLAGCELLYESLSETALSDYEFKTATGLDWYGHYTDEMTYTAYTTPYAVSVDFFGYIYSGGAHPGKGNICHLFDLEAGEMVNVDDIADGDAFRSAVAEEVLAQIEKEGLAEGYYEDYETTVREQNEVQYFFSEDQVTVYFQDYTLGPYAAGYPVFIITSDIYRPTLNERGLRLLGYTE